MVLSRDAEAQETPPAGEAFHNLDMKEVAESVRNIREAWREKNYDNTVSLSRKLLAWEPGNIYGLMYLARAASYTGDWGDVAAAGVKLTRHRPRDAFNAGRKLNRAGRTLDAAEIYGRLEIRESWFDVDVVELAWKEGLSLLTAGEAAQHDGNYELAKALWVAGSRIAPRNEILADRVRHLAFQALRQAKGYERNGDPAAYSDAWREVLRLSPTNVLAAEKVAWAQERLDHKDAIDAWLEVLAIAPGHEKAMERIRILAVRQDLEDHAIRGLVEQGRDEGSDPLIRALAEGRDVKAREAHDKILKVRRREALARAHVVDFDAEPRKYLAVWKDVLVLDPTDARAAKKVARVAKQLEDHSEHFEGLTALFEISPQDEAVRDRLITVARRAGQEQRALEILAVHGRAHLGETRIATLHRRVLSICKNALKIPDLDFAIACLRTLVRIDHEYPLLDALRQSVVKKAVSSAKEADREGNLAIAIPLAEHILEIVPDHPVALKIIARDLLRHNRCEELVALCQPRVKPSPEYEPVQKLLDRANLKLAS